MGCAILVALPYIVQRTDYINNRPSSWRYRLIPATYVTLLERCIDQSETRNETTVHISVTSYITF